MYDKAFKFKTQDIASVTGLSHRVIRDAMRQKKFNPRDLESFVLWVGGRKAVRDAGLIRHEKS